MIKTEDYSTEDIDKFLEAYKIEQEKPRSKSLQKLMNIQDKIPFFKGIAPLELKAIVYDVKFRKFNNKEYIVEEGSYSNEIFFLIQGKCQVYHKNKEVGDIRPGEIFGEVGAIFKTKRNATVVCSTQEAKLLSFCIDEENMQFCCRALAILYKNIASEITSKLELANDLCIARSTI